MSLSKDGIDNISLQFTRTPAMYRAGEDLMGRIIVICNETTPVKGIKLHIFGRMNIYWKKVEGGATSEYAEIEEYIDESIKIWVPNPRKKDEQWIYPGKMVLRPIQPYYHTVILEYFNIKEISTF